MRLLNKYLFPGGEDEKVLQNSEAEAIEDDGAPVLDEKDLEENGLTVEDAEEIEWDDAE
jgi:hypothetical protein